MGEHVTNLSFFSILSASVMAGWYALSGYPQAIYTESGCRIIFVSLFFGGLVFFFVGLFVDSATLFLKGGGGWESGRQESKRL